jgi:hypothetical protein
VDVIIKGMLTFCWSTTTHKTKRTCSDKIDLFWTNETDPKWVTDAPVGPAGVGGASLNILQSGKAFIGVIVSTNNQARGRKEKERYLS